MKNLVLLISLLSLSGCISQKNLVQTEKEIEAERIVQSIAWENLLFKTLCLENTSALINTRIVDVIDDDPNYLTKEDKTYIKKNTPDKTIKWSEKLTLDFKKNCKYSMYISYPIFYRNNSLALVSQSRNGCGSIDIYEKKGNHWVSKKNLATWLGC